MSEEWSFGMKKHIHVLTCPRNMHAAENWWKPAFDIWINYVKETHTSCIFSLFHFFFQTLPGVTRFCSVFCLWHFRNNFRPRTLMLILTLTNPSPNPNPKVGRVRGLFYSFVDFLFGKNRICRKKSGTQNCIEFFFGGGGKMYTNITYDLVWVYCKNKTLPVP